MRIVAALRSGDERAFALLVAELGPAMLRVASLFVRERAVAEEVVQEAWLRALRSLDGFEGRSSFRTWLMRILTNTAKTRAERESRSIPFSALARSEVEEGEPAVDSERFLAQPDRYGRQWASEPLSFGELPESRLLAAETLSVVHAALEQLPEVQRAVMTMRDIGGFPPDEVCSELELTEANQRVLLHRARSKVRRALEEYFEAVEAS